MLLPETGRLIGVWHTSTHAHAQPAVITYLTHLQPDEYIVEVLIPLVLHRDILWT